MQGKLSLPRAPDIAFQSVCDTAKRIPLFDDGYVPLRLDRDEIRQTTIIEPQFYLADSALRMSLGRPFGFIAGRPGQYVRSQKTDGVLYENHLSSCGDWHVTVDTPQELTEVDRNLFVSGLRSYLIFTATKMAKDGKNSFRLA